MVINIWKRFLLYSPLNQGLKQEFNKIAAPLISVFTLQSIKSRIETNEAIIAMRQVETVFTLQSIKSRIETTIHNSGEEEKK